MKSRLSYFITKLNTSPPAPQPKQCQICFCGLTLKLGVFVAAYPVLWLVTRYAMGLSTDAQLAVLGFGSVLLLIWGVLIGNAFRTRANVGEEN